MPFLNEYCLEILQDTNCRALAGSCARPAQQRFWGGLARGSGREPRCMCRQPFAPERPSAARSGTRVCARRSNSRHLLNVLEFNAYCLPWGGGGCCACARGRQWSRSVHAAAAAREDSSWRALAGRPRESPRASPLRHWSLIRRRPQAARTDCSTILSTGSRRAT